VPRSLFYFTLFHIPFSFLAFRIIYSIYNFQSNDASWNITKIKLRRCDICRMRTLTILTKRKQIFPIYHSNHERERNQWNFATVVPQKFASPDFRHARVSHRFLWFSDSIREFSVTFRDPRFRSDFREQDLVSPGGPGIAATNAFEQLRKIELRVAATLTPPEVGVCQFSAHTHISWTSAYWKLVSPHLPLTIVTTKICLRPFVRASIPLSRALTNLFSSIPFQDTLFFAFISSSTWFSIWGSHNWN